MDLIRYFLPITPVENREGDSLADLGFAFFLVFIECLDVRVLPTNGAADPYARVFIGYDEAGEPVFVGSRWEDYAPFFTTPVDRPFINVCCGTLRELAHYHTPPGKNLGITFCRKPEPLSTVEAVLSQYDAVLCPTSEDATALVKQGMAAVELQPEVDQVGRLLKGL